MCPATNKFKTARQAFTGPIIVCLTFLLSCLPAASTKITGTWKDPGAGSYKDFFVAVLSKKLQTRKTVEFDLSSRLKKEGVNVEPSLDIFPHTEEVETKEQKEAAVEKIKSLGHDAIITVRLLKKTEESRYVPGKVQYAPTNIGYGTGYNNEQHAGNPGAGTPGAFGYYYIDNYALASSEGHDETISVYFIESRLFEASTGKLVWSVQSETFNPTNLPAFSAEFSEAVINSLKSNKLIAGK